jgi:hypothetical protein
VLVAAPEPAAVSPSAQASDTNASSREASEPSFRDASDTRPSNPSNAFGNNQGASFDSETVLALADNAADKAELAVSAYQALARTADLQAQHVRRSARFAWSAVAVMTVGVVGAVGWTSHRLTRAELQAENLERVVQSAVSTATSVSAERDTLRAEVASAREQTARAEGRLAALSDVQAKLEAQARAQAQRPTTRPTLADRLTWIFQD